MSPRDDPTAGAAQTARAPLTALAEHGWRVEDVARRGAGPWIAEGADAGVDYPDDGHALLAGVEDARAWYRERNRLIGDAILRDGVPASFLEIGAGNGVVAEHLRGLGIDAAAVEPARDAAERAAARGVPTVCGLLEDLRLPDGSLAAAGLFDVIEHLAAPGDLLGQVRRVLAPGGRLVVTVPAHPWLWSAADVEAGHHRRYSRASLIRELEAAGFVVGRCEFAFGALVPAVALLRALPDRLGRERSAERQAAVATREVAGYGSLGQRASGAAFAAERRLRASVGLPTGTSLLGTFHRPARPS